MSDDKPYSNYDEAAVDALKGLEAWLPSKIKKHENPSNLKEFFENVRAEESENFWGIGRIVAFKANPFLKMIKKTKIR